jgi:hypothetical protein
MSNLVELKREYDRARRAELETDEAKAIINTHLELNGGDDVARTATDPEKRDEELKKIAKDVINEVNASHDAGLTAEGLNLVQTEILAQFAILRERVDAKFEELATSQEDALRDALQGVSKKLDTLVAEREKASETIGSGEKNILEQIEAMGEVVDANATTLEYIEYQVDDLGGKMKNMEHRINVNTAKELKTLSGLAKELHGSGNNAPVANASAALEADTPTQTINQDTGKKKKKNKAQPSAMTATTATTKRATCMATKTDGSQCTMLAKPGFLTCSYQAHRAQEEELKKKAVPVPRVDSTASFQDTATNAQAPPTTTQPSVAQGTRPSRFKPPPGAATKKRKRGGDDEEELEHNHLPGETREDCRACAMGCGELTQPTISPILHSEEADQCDYNFDSPEPENQVAHGFPPSPPINGPIHNIHSPTSTEADRLEAEHTGFRNHEEVVKELERLERLEKSQQNQHGVRMKQPTKPGTGPDRFFREAPRRNAGSNW